MNPENEKPVDRLDGALMDIRNAAETHLEVGERRKDRIIRYARGLTFVVR